MIPSAWFFAMLAATAAWLWPIGVGGQMPVGGDVTAFSIGLMDVYRDAIRAGRLPLWNDLWGYGFPGLAESQMGVYYPPNWLAYRVFSVEVAAVAIQTVHAFWGAIGTYWLARRIGLTPRGAALAGFAWTGSGMSLIHLSHHWYFPTASWMPWAWGSAWTFLYGDAGRRRACLLAAILAVQILPGHFQIAFTTEVSVLVIAAWSLCGRGGRSLASVRRAAVVGVIPLAALAMAAAQVWPTLQNAQLTTSKRTIDYLSWLPSPPTHYVNLVAPGLFQRSALWRPIVWDPFRAMPEEHYPYLGLAPLFLALGAIARGSRRDPITRMLLALAVAGTLLAFGPFVPGYPALIRLPGFSFFRVPARWNVTVLLALALLAGKGLDCFSSWKRPSAWLAVFAMIAAALPLLAIAGFELALASTSGGGAVESPVASAFDRLTNSLPGAPPGAFRRIMAAARAPTRDTNISVRLVREGYRLEQVDRLTLEHERFGIYLREVGEPGLILLGLLATALVANRKRRAAEASLLLLAALDLIALSRHRQVDVAPVRSLIEMSPVLARMAAMPRGQRTLDSLKNLPMRAGAAPIGAYRTLDREALPFLTTIASGPPDGPLTLRSLAAVGAAARVFEPFDPLAATLGDRAERIDDVALAGWIYGRRWAESVEGSRFRTFTFWPTGRKAARAWLIPGPLPPLDQPALVLDLLERATPLQTTSKVPEEVEVAFRSTGPGTLLLSQLADPEWTATLRGGGAEADRAILPAFGTMERGAWQAIAIPGAGDWSLRLVYEGRAAKAGLIGSAVAWSLWLLAFAWPTPRSRAIPGRSRPAENAAPNAPDSVEPVGT